MSTTYTADDFLLGGGGASAKFETLGDTITGVIESTEVNQQTDIKDGSPKTWDNGDPIMQLVVTLQTSLREDEDDDGKRKVYVKGSKKAGSRSLHDAVATAVRNSGARGLEVGGTLTVTHDGVEPSKTRGFNDRKLYSATYAAPDKAAQTGDFLGTGTAPAPAFAPQAAPAAVVAPPAAAAPALPPGMTPEQVAALAAWQAQQQAQAQPA